MLPSTLDGPFELNNAQLASDPVLSLFRVLQLRIALSGALLFWFFILLFLGFSTKPI